MTLMPTSAWSAAASVALDRPEVAHQDGDEAQGLLDAGGHREPQVVERHPVPSRLAPACRQGVELAGRGRLPLDAEGDEEGDPLDRAPELVGAQRPQGLDPREDGS